MVVPGRNIVKIYDDNGYYHVYNRGVEKRNIFLDHQDYVVFLSYLKDYLCPDDDAPIKIFPSRKLRNFSERIDLLSYCLMPNHFHLLIKQSSRMAMTSFMRSLLTRYSMYFNRKYDRVGSLFQGNYKAVMVTSEEQLVYLTHYIHRNPMGGSDASGLDLEGLMKYRYSSLGNYLGKIKQYWVKPNRILELFSRTSKNLSYKSFVFDMEIDTSGLDLEVD